MAGLLTFVSARGRAAAHRERVVEALELLRHRGPDDTNVVVTDDVVFGADRLAVTDLTGGRQPVSFPPMGVTRGRYLIVFDGAVYNAAELREELVEDRGADFATESEAEVILAAYHHWGPSVLSRLRGMFAFVIWDGSARRAFGARDPYGVKPLYQLTTDDGVYLASERKALLPFVAEERRAAVDPANLQHYLTMQYVPEPATMHPDIRRLGAGESFVYTPGGPLANRRYSQLDLRPTPTGDEDGLVRRITEGLRDSVRAHLKADVPVGAFLSSGIDSTAIVALAAEADPQLRTYTVGYDIAQFSEIEVAEQSARALGVRNTATVVNPADLMRALPRIVWHLDDPVADPALVPLFLLAERAARDVTVVLGGDGADELFGGYPIYREPLSLAGVSHLPDSMQRGLRAVSRVIPQGVKGKSFLERGTTPIEERYYGNARIFSEEEKAALLRHYTAGIRHTDVTAPVFKEASALDDVATMQYIDLYTWLRGDILVKADRMTMAHGLQLRTPFLDRAVFEVASTLPSELKVPPRSQETKAALRRALAGIVPEPIVNRKKLGFPVPIRPWLRTEMHDWAHGILDSSGAGDLLDLDVVRGLLKAHRKKEADHSRKIWTVLVFCVWHAVFVTGQLKPVIPDAVPHRHTVPESLGLDPW
ncbi:asparagine synthase (glutamine-hydrolyzing) [Dactylosporangium aurantiacum]|uniref:asparagine synthase (glutamine-hydrolyzing) n=1 Tax=Dactylosporangium aurantiacum TaxID=35754 RepID=A0A9Q9MJ06_9ACTN|nr:asparagine synthase (glutamine-hydrolyzing) [Dactylosporangium aurantiacum]MDG6109331.1 asparagine synthase (glutamine-hydrolyzing) [Dactylosporangium aurantiacum]UWZ56440.1 asparagine synthase (glutamine-hydrolyzing) [Dactylosporangium aurantiacum]